MQAGDRMPEHLKTIAEAFNGIETIFVLKDGDRYHIAADRIIRHPNCTPDDAIRALCVYAHQREARK